MEISFAIVSRHDAITRRSSKKSSGPSPSSFDESVHANVAESPNSRSATRTAATPKAFGSASAKAKIKVSSSSSEKYSRDVSSGPEKKASSSSFLSSSPRPVSFAAGPDDVFSDPRPKPRNAAVAAFASSPIRNAHESIDASEIPRDVFFFSFVERRVASSSDDPHSVANLNQNAPASRETPNSAANLAIARLDAAAARQDPSAAWYTAADAATAQLPRRRSADATVSRTREATRRGDKSGFFVPVAARSSSREGFLFPSSKSLSAGSPSGSFPSRDVSTNALGSLGFASASGS